MNGTVVDLDGLAQSLADVSGVAVERDAPAGRFCTYRTGGPLAVLAVVSRRDAMVPVAQRIAAAGVDTLVVGRGSNLLVADAGFAGVAIHLVDDFETIDIDRTNVAAGGAALLPRMARATVAAGLAGFEWAVGVPGSLGGAVRMNAGGHGSDMAASLLDAEVVDLTTGAIEVLDAAALDFGYRHSSIAPHQLVVSARLALEPGDGGGEDLLKEIVGWRRAHQPGGANAGSVFTNPEGDSAGRLIDVSEGKGRRVGSAEVSEKHANFIQVDEHGSADDVMALMREVVDLVDAEHGVRLHAETRLIGFDPGDVRHVQGERD